MDTHIYNIIMYTIKSLSYILATLIQCSMVVYIVRDVIIAIAKRPIRH